MKTKLVSILFVIGIILPVLNVKLTGAEPSGTDDQSAVTVKVMQKTFPTYLMGPDEQNPFFIDFSLPGISFFRSSRAVYPYTFQNHYTNIKKDESYEVVRLENEYIYVDVIPDLRGRIQGAYDKRNGWDFLYYNHVIKPAEIAVRSAWLSGGIEWTHPGGHGYTQLNRIPYRIIDEPDGGKSIIVGEIEKNRELKWESKITLRPGRLYVETTGRIMSIHPYSVPFASSDNGAAHGSDEMEVIYPPNTYTIGHSRDTSTYKWPFIDNTGTDYSKFSETKRTLSVFAMGNALLEDFWGVYSHDKNIDAGTAIVSDHRKAPGKKYFTWGSHEQGRLWDKILSDDDGPYVEVQVQAFFDHLNYGYAKIDPMEIKEYTTYWIPVMKTGGFVKVTENVVLNLVTNTPGKLTLVLQPTRMLPNSSLKIWKNGSSVVEKTVSLSPEEIWKEEFSFKYSKEDELTVKITDNNGLELISYSNRSRDVHPKTYIVSERQNADLTADQLFTVAKSNKYDPLGIDAEKTYKKILEIDPLESRANRELGIIYYQRGLRDKAIEHLERSLENDHMEESYETYYLLGLVSKEKGDLFNAKKFLVIASRNKSVKQPALTELIRIAYIEGRYRDGLEMAEEMLREGMAHPSVYDLISYGNRKTGNKEEAEKACKKALEIDPLSFVTYAEMWFNDPTEERKATINSLFDRRDSTFVGTQLYFETSGEYVKLRDYQASLEIMKLASDYFTGKRYRYPLIDYYMGYYAKNSGQADLAAEYYLKASMQGIKYVFPYQALSENVLNDAIANNPGDAKAYYLLGNLYFGLRRHNEALRAWEVATRKDDKNAYAFRNLANAIYLAEKDTLKTLQLLEKASDLATGDLRILQELESTYDAMGMKDKRLTLLEKRLNLVKSSPEMALNLADLYLAGGSFDKAAQLMETTYFPATEGSVGRNIRYARYAEAHLGMGESLLEKGNTGDALEHLRKSMEYPGNLNEKAPNNPDYTRAFYLIAQAHEKTGNNKLSREFYKKAASLSSTSPSESVYFKAMALKKLGDTKNGDLVIKILLDNASGPADARSSDRRGGGGVNAAGLLYLQSLAYKYLGDDQKSKEYLGKAMNINPDVIIESRIGSRNQ